MLINDRLNFYHKSLKLQVLKLFIEQWCFTCVNTAEFVCMLTEALPTEMSALCSLCPLAYRIKPPLGWLGLPEPVFCSGRPQSRAKQMRVFRVMRKDNFKATPQKYFFWSCYGQSCTIYTFRLV